MLGLSLFYLQINCLLRLPSRHDRLGRTPDGRSTEAPMDTAAGRDGAGGIRTRLTKRYNNTSIHVSLMSTILGL